MANRIWCLLCVLLLASWSVSAQGSPPAAPKSPESPQSGMTIGTALSQIRNEGEWLQLYSARLDAMLQASATLAAESSSWQTEFQRRFELSIQEFSTRLSKAQNNTILWAALAGAGWAAAIGVVTYTLIHPK